MASTRPSTVPDAASQASPGLTGAEAARRLAERGRLRRPASSRSYTSIVRANVFTVFNLILVSFGALTLTFGDWRDALFLGIVVANSMIGITQEVRAKRALDRLAALVVPTATVVRDGAPEQLGVEQVVDGDLVELSPGDQVVADGRLVEESGLSLDESILSGESAPVARRGGERIRSGSFVVEGVGSYLVEAVGPESYAERIAGQARAFRHSRSPLERALNRLLLSLVAAVAVLGSLLVYSLWRREEPIADAVATATAGVVSLVPEGLILLTSLTYAVGALRMARRGALAQQLNAIESLAAVDVVLTDKTGTLTEPSLRVVEALPATGVGEAELGASLARFAAASRSTNGTLEAIAARYPGERRPAAAQVPFSSRRRWSAVEVGDELLVLAAPELLSLGSLAPLASERAAGGRRVVALGRAPGALDGEPAPEAPPPAGVEALGVVVLGERLRPNASETVRYLLEEGVELKVLSGDDPRTAAAIARDCGIDVGPGPVDGRRLPDDADELGELIERSGVVGRISPEGKKRVVEALRDRGRYVAMVGDGVNDVPALKAARLAIAQGSGAQMAKSVADLVLVGGDFAVVPRMLAEGRQALRNLQRVAKLYVTKSSFAAFLILMIGTTSTAYPLLPRHFTIAAALTIGIPSFFLALAPSSGPWRSPAWVRDVARFAVPAGTIVGAGVLASYLVALEVLGLGLVEARTVATSVVVAAGLYLVIALEASGRLRGAAVGAMCLAMLVLYALALALPPAREFFALAIPGPSILATAGVGAGLAIGALYLSGFMPGRGERPGPP